MEERLLSEKIWLSENVTWKQVEATHSYPQLCDLLYAIPIAFAYVIVRFLCTRLVLIPFGQYFAIKNKKANPVQPQPILEAVFKSRQTNKYDFQYLASELRWTVREVEMWLRHRKRMDSFTQMNKFCESAWRFLYYVVAVVFGLRCFWKEPWLTNSTLFYVKSPLETILTPQMRWYYILQIGYCGSLLINQLSDVKRKDFRMMFVHHVYFLTLTIVSWCVNAVYIGIIVLLIHDITDVPLEATKCSIYLKKKTAQSFCFISFALLWILFRLIIFPYLIFMLIKDAYPYVALFPYIVIAAFLIGLQILHIIWSNMILNMFLNSLKAKEFSDVRSESEGESSNEDEKSK